ncbi:MAG: FHA domain-containing protein [Candidatus Hodarchaeota archaeon]
MIHNTNERPNPYIGPRAFKYGETLYGRDREVLDLLDLLIAERIILLNSPSGAGKTSLIQSALIPELEKEDFHVLPVMRVSLEPPEGLDEGLIKNRYVFSLLLSLEEGLPKKRHSPLVDLAQLTLADYLDRRAKAETDLESDVLIFDQFEEVLTINPTDRSAKKEFFVQLGTSLRNRNRWAIFALREEYVASLEPYLRYIPTRLSNTFRLELLSEESARQAMQEPARANGVEFTDAAARKMVDDLRRAWVQHPDGSKKLELGPYVEPVQLQVVCLQLWDRLPSDDLEIDEDDVRELGDVDSALTSFYDEQVAAIAKKGETKERLIREWFEHQLITEQGVRRDVLQGPEKSQGLENKVIWSLVDTHIVRAERRRGFTWFELAHDRLIEPVRGSNAAWFEANLSPLQRQAAIWERQGRPGELLLKDHTLTAAEKWADSNYDRLTAIEDDFLNSCRQLRTTLRRIRWLKMSVAFSILLLLAFVSYNFYTLWLESRPWGYFKNLSTGTVHRLKDKLISVGRSTEDVKNQVDLRNRYISRMHLSIFKDDLVTLDMRSTNGTTVDAKFLPYDDARKLEDGSIVVLAGIAPFQFERIVYSTFQFWSPSILKIPGPSDSDWGILIDGQSRTYRYLNTSRHFISLDDQNRIILSKQETDNKLLTIEKHLDKIRLEEHDDQIRLIARWKKTDYLYPETKIRSGEIIDFSLREIGNITFRYKDTPFQIVPILSNLESDSIQ